jgi:uncharacterized protein (TIGR03437 family)
VNAASWSEIISPGSLIAIFGSNLAAGQASASAPLPLTLAGTSVTVNGVAAPLTFVSPGQLDAQVPSSLTAPAHSIIAVTITVTTPAGSASIQTGLASGAPGLFTADSSGCGQAAALNIRPDGAVSVNSPSNSASPGDYIALFGTGFGVSAQPAADGAAATGLSPLSELPILTVDDAPLPSLAYAGLAPGLAGVDQINFQVPATVRNGCAVPVVTASQGLSGPPTTVSIQSGGGQCMDPPIQSYGRIVLNSFVAGGPDGDSFSARFPAAPNLEPPTPDHVVFAPDYASNQNGLSFFNSAFLLNPRSCAVPGYTSLSAGSIRVTSPFAISATFEPRADAVSGVLYSGNLPPGFVGPGVYTLTGTTGASVNLSAKMTVGSPIRMQTALAPGTAISSSQPFTIHWTGGDSNSLVRLGLTFSSGDEASGIYTYAHAVDGVLTIGPVCAAGNASNPEFCLSGIPASSNASISVQVIPDPSKIPTASVPGVTGPVFLSWAYAYWFPSLVLSQ